ncbi:MAG: SUF system NifU family Fe-S cluster assembly protein [Elusimicrobia bacterium]|nr:SUF system NifU family Fe-S cluster assembly protein [Elusimicrobiota bacterium]
MAEGDAELQDLYRDVLLDYFRSASRKGKVEPADCHSHGINPVCGDEVEITLRLGPQGSIQAIRYQGHGCVISQASSAMMAEALEGSSLSRARELVGIFKEMMLSGSERKLLPTELEALAALEGVRKYPMRVKCATLAWNTLLQGLSSPAAAGEFQEVE